MLSRGKAARPRGKPDREREERGEARNGGGSLAAAAAAVAGLRMCSVGPLWGICEERGLAEEVEMLSGEEAGRRAVGDEEEEERGELERCDPAEGML